MNKDYADYKRYKSIAELIEKNPNGDFKKAIIGEEITNEIASDGLSGDFGGIALYFNEVIFNCRLNIYNLKTDCSIWFYNCKFPLGVSISRGVEMIDTIFFSDCKIFSFFEISDYKSLNLIEISNCNVDRMKIEATLFHQIRFHEMKILSSSNIKELKIVTENNFEGIITLSNIDVDTLLVSGIRGKLKLNINNCRLNDIILLNLNEDVWVKMMNSNFVKKHRLRGFLISESILSKCEFFNLDFSQFDRVLVHDSNLNNALFVNVKWGNNINQCYYSLNVNSNSYIEFFDCGDIKKDSDYYEKLAQVYKQLKFSLSKTGDKVQEKYFHALEMRNLDKSMSLFSRRFFTKLILRLSYWFSDFGQSVSRPLLGMLIICWFYFIFLLSEGHFKDLEITYLLNTDREGFNKGLLEYVKLFSPIRKELDTSSGLIASLDLLVRIISSFMIYNFARATRQYIN